ncbi:MAG: hypothetical protein JOY60_07700 [Burkholderiaceae bacterium]|nr:hypothetical protein [Burkholderiaceae bacterium]
MGPALVAALLASGPAAAMARADQAAASAPMGSTQTLSGLLTRQDYAAARAPVRELMQKAHTHAAERALIYQWLFASDDMAELDRRTHDVLSRPEGKVFPVDLQAAGRLALETHAVERAQRCFEQALRIATHAQDKAAALKGLGQIAYLRLDFDQALRRHQQGLALYVSADGLMALSDTLIRLGRTQEAVQAAERAVQLNPYHEVAHYQLGNGYTSKNYTQLAAEYGPRYDEAMALTRRASYAFEQGRFDSARDLAFDALRLCPPLGRAHAVLAKALESQRFAIDVHRAAYEQRFAAMPMPEVPGIERYVLNWNELSPRHQKRVALSLAPWKAYIPVLVEGGATLFIKPMYMRLSDTPELQSLKDQRIDYDSRLWDDVRGNGGYNTVTGIEDVERIIFDRYNTVLHELTHQVHGVLLAGDWREIQDLYRRAKQREAQTHQGFMSRYASGSVWEYFAEGANAWGSPQRDRYDPREVVRERLQAMDPDLLALETRLMAQQDVRASLPVALANAGNHQLELGDAAKAREFFARAGAIAPDDELVLAARLYGLSVQNSDADAKTQVQALADRALQQHPDSGAVRVSAAQALWHMGTPLSDVLPLLEARRDVLTGDDRYQVDLALADAQRKLGHVDAALAAYDAVLASQADSPEGLWGKAATLALAQRWDQAFAVYDQVVRLRTGMVPIRADLIRDLLRAGRKDQARAQLAEAQLLDPVDPTLLALDAWLALVDQHSDLALEKSDKALAQGPWCDLAVVVRSAAFKALGQPDQARAASAELRQRIASMQAPGYVFRPDQSIWVSTHELPAVERQLLDTL